MLVPRAVPELSEDSQMPPAERLGLSQSVGGAEQHGQVVETDCHVGMLRAEARFRDGKRPEVKQLGLSQPVGGADVGLYLNRRMQSFTALKSWTDKGTARYSTILWAPCGRHSPPFSMQGRRSRLLAPV
jgi:hypothetical protein